VNIVLLQIAHHVIYMQFVSLRFSSILDLNDALRGTTQGFVPRAHEQVNTALGTVDIKHRIIYLFKLTGYTEQKTASNTLYGQLY
jgi:hypothetical protein